MTIKSIPCISIITVVLNDLNGFKKTFESIKRQTFNKYEWVVIDGSSVDGTKEYIVHIEDQVKKWISEEDNGIYDAMNKGIRIAGGEYLVFMNAGDVFFNEESLQSVFDHLQQQVNKPDVVFGGTSLVLSNGRTIYRGPRSIETYIWHGMPAYHQATYYLRNRIVESMYDTNYRICGDYYIIAYLYSKGIKASYLDMPVVRFRVGDTSYHRPFKLLWESYCIQKDVLNLSCFKRHISVAKRSISLLGVFILSRINYSFIYKMIFGSKL